MTTPDALTTLASQGFTHLLLQIGASPEPTVGVAAGTADVRGENDDEDVGEEAEQKGSTGTFHLRRRPKRSSGGGNSSSNERGEVAVSWYRYKDSLRADMEAADLIVSHAGT